MNNTFLTPINPEFWFIFGIPTIFLLGSLAHYAYEWSGKSTIVGIFTPVNESIWEHLKLSTYPPFIWYIIGSILFSNRVNLYDWCICSVISVIISDTFITAYYYTYTGAFGIHSLFLDIFSLFLGLAIAQSLSLYIYNHIRLTTLHFYLSIMISSLIVICFTLFTFFPPKLPLFMDTVTKQYGIQ